MILDYPRHRSTLEYSVSSDKTWTITGTNTHERQATYLNHLGIYFAWGYEVSDNPELPWDTGRTANVIENRLDFFYGANIVYSANYYSLDSGRCLVPKVVGGGLELPECQHRFFRFFNSLLKKEGASEYDRLTLETCSFKLVQNPWPAI